MRPFLIVSLLLAMVLPAASDPLVIAHRGASAVAPENTVAAIREAIRLGSKVIEFDVRVTSDGELVLFHDKELDRLVGRPGTIEASDWATVRTFDVGKWFAKGDFAGERVIRLEEAIRLCVEGGATPLIEQKTGPAAAYAEVLRELGAADRVIVQSFDWEFLVAFRKELPEVPIGALGSKELSEEKLANLAKLAPDWVGWNFGDLKTDQVPALRELGAKIAVWTVNDPLVAKSWVEAGADAIITDVPDAVAAVLAGE